MASSRLQPGPLAADLPMAIPVFPVNTEGLARCARQILGLPIEERVKRR